MPLIDLGMVFVSLEIDVLKKTNSISLDSIDLLVPKLSYLPTYARGYRWW